MDTGSGHIFNKDKIKIENIKGELVPWEVGEEVEVKECLFEVKEIKIFPDDLIILKGKANIKKLTQFQELSSALSETIPEESPHKILDFVRKKK